MEKVPNNVREFKKVYKELVPKLVEIRKQSGTNIEQMADWLKIIRNILKIITKIFGK